MKWTVLFIIFAAEAPFASEYVLRAKVDTEETALRCRAEEANGKIGSTVGMLPKNSLVEIDTAYLLRQLSLEENQEIGRSFLRQSVCRMSGETWKGVGGQKEVSGQQYNYIKVLHQGRSCFASLEFLKAHNFSCEQLRSNIENKLKASVTASGVCSKDCALSEETTTKLVQGWADILENIGRKEENAVKIESSRVLRDRAQSLCAQIQPDTEQEQMEAIEESAQESPSFPGFLSLESKEFACGDLADPRSSVTPPDSLSLRELPAPAYGSYTGKDLAMAKLESLAHQQNKLSVFRLYKNNFQTLCDNLPEKNWMECYDVLANHFMSANSCFEDRFPAKQNRHILSSFLRDPRILKLAFIPLLTGKNSSVSSCGDRADIAAQKACALSILDGEEKAIFEKRAQLWDEFNVVALAPGLEVDGYRKTEVIAPLSLEGLDRVLRGYRSIRSTMESSGTGQDLSHVWGGGGFMARTRDLSVNGQFGQIFGTSPLVMHMVIDPSKTNRNGRYSSPPKSINTIAERLAHENFHAQDFIDGRTSFNTISWSESRSSNRPNRKIFDFCSEHNQDMGRGDFKNCQRQMPDLFSFRSGTYQASNVYEFYGSMANVWLRNARAGRSQKGYACKNSRTETLWREMETQLLGSPVTRCD